MSDLLSTVVATAQEQKSMANQRKATVVRICGEEHNATTPPDDDITSPQTATVYFCTDPEMAYLAQWRFKLIIGDPLGNRDANIDWGEQPNYGILDTSHAPWGSVNDFYQTVYGYGVNMDGAYGLQCWDLMCYFTNNQAGHWLQTGSQIMGTCYSGVYWSWANETVRNNNKANGKFDAIAGGSDILPGDIVICDLGTVMGDECGNIKVGHTGMALDSSNSTIYREQGKIHLLGQNQGGYPYRQGGAYTNVITIPVSSILGVFRYTGSEFIRMAPPGYDV